MCHIQVHQGAMLLVGFAHAHGTGQRLGEHHRANRFGQLQQPHEVRHGAAILAHGLRDLLLRETETVGEGAYAYVFDASGIEGTDGLRQLYDFLQPRIEGEIAFVLKRELPGCFQVGGVTNVDVIAATDFTWPTFSAISTSTTVVGPVGR